MAKRKQVSLTIDEVVLRRLDRLAKSASLTRSAMFEQFVKDGLDDAEVAVKAFTDPVLLKVFGEAFADRDVLKSMAAAVHEEMSDDQLDLFTSRVRALSAKPGKKGKK